MTRFEPKNLPIIGLYKEVWIDTHFSGRWPTSLVRESAPCATTGIAVAFAEIVQQIFFKFTNNGRPREKRNLPQKMFTISGETQTRYK